ncbi:MAG: translation initiation factor IF-2 [Clostridiales bacterium]|nr:translation initiation factor IF-2 [Clostridiales bacterium]
MTTDKKINNEKSIQKINTLLRNKEKGSESFATLQYRLRDVMRRIDGAIASAAQKNKTETPENIAEEKKTTKKPLPPVQEVVEVAPTVEVTPEIKEEKPVVQETVQEAEKKIAETSTVEVKAEPKVEPQKPTKQKQKVEGVKLTNTEVSVPSYVKKIDFIPNTAPPKAPRSTSTDKNGQFNRTKNFTKEKTFEKSGKPFEKPAFDKSVGENKHQSAGASKTSQQKPARPSATASLPPITGTKDRRVNDKKRDLNKQVEDKKSMNKRTLIRKGFITEDFDEERMGTRKLKNKKAKEVHVFQPVKIEKAVITTENLTVKILSEKIGKTAQEIIKQLMILGIMTNINGVVDFATMELVANELGVELELKLEQTKEEQLEALHEEEDKEEDLVKRPPIITVMGHVDHGKTSLLDAIRKTTVAAGEAGGITQHIGAYSVQCKGETITFLDTPGHEAFTEMRARGALVTDIVILIVAADDGIMPQTIEAIHHAKAANVPIVVAINKIDKPGANIEKVKQTLTDHELVPEEWGGDTMIVPISAKKGIGIENLLESILFLAEYNNYRANPKRQAKCSIIESKLDKGKGPVANIIVQNGTLHVGDYVVSGVTSGRIRAMVDDKGRNIKEAGPSTPVSVLGFSDVPNAGDTAFVVDDEKMAKQVISEREAKLKNEAANQNQKVTLDDVFNKINEGQMKELNIIVKGDVQGSVEALKASLEKLTNDEVKVVVVHGGVGAINKSDVMLAGVSNAIIIGFNVRPDSEAKATAENAGTEIKLYSVIYDAIDDITNAMKGLVAPKYKEVITGRAQVRNVFKISSVGEVAGSYVLDGKIVRNSHVRIFRDNVKIFEGPINNLKRFKDDAKEVAAGYECGISVEGFIGFKELDEIESYVMEEEK